MLIAQAALVSNTRSHLAVARRMYAMRFTDEDVTKLTMQQLRGREGARVRTIYRNASKKTGVSWSGREYDPSDFSAGNPVNMALSAAHACLYGVAHSVITALGCAPGLGFIHTGHERSFVYDIADLYKADITIPIAFEVAAQQPENIGAVTRRAVRDAIADSSILEHMVKDIRELLLGVSEDGSLQEVPEIDTNTVHLWDDKNGFVKNAVSYGKELDELGEDEAAITEGYGTLLEEET
jgi:CRISPR-associated protein Cas1